MTAYIVDSIWIRRYLSEKPYERLSELAIIREIPRKVKDLSGTFPDEAEASAACRTA
jgi:hypothetical protein